MLCTMIAGAQQANLAVVHTLVWTGNAAHPWAGWCPSHPAAHLPIRPPSPGTLPPALSLSDDP
jgi:hypothetical protein